MIFFSMEILPVKGGGFMQVFDCKTKIVSGEDALSWLDKHHCRCLLVVTDPYFRQNGWADRIAGRVQAEKREFGVG